MIWWNAMLGAALSGGGIGDGTTVLRVKMNGSGTFAGQSWTSDVAYRTVAPSNTFSTGATTILDTDTPSFYYTGAYAQASEWTFPVAPGIYDVYLYLVDNNLQTGPAANTSYNIGFNGASVESGLVLKQFLFEPVSLRKKYTVSCPGTSLVLNLSRVLTFDVGIAGIEIVPPGTSPTIGVTSVSPFASPPFNGSLTKDKVFDGNNSTEYLSNLPNNIGAAVGFDMGSSRTVATINFTPSPSSPGRSNGAKLYGSNSKYTNYTLLYTIPSGQATVGAKVASIPSGLQGPWRYIVYEAPANEYCNFAEISVP